MGPTSSTAARHHEGPLTRSTPVLGPMDWIRYHMNSHASHVSYTPSSCSHRRITFHSNPEARTSYNRHNSSREGFREKDPGYVGIRANEALWRNLCTERLGCYFFVCVKEKTWQIWQETHRRRTHNPFHLCPVNYLRSFENAWSPSTRQIPNRHTCTLTLWPKPQRTRTLPKHKKYRLLVFLSRHHPFISQASSE